MFGMAGREHMEKYGSEPDDYAWIGWKNHKHSVNNPYAQFYVASGGWVVAWQSNGIGTSQVFQRVYAASSNLSAGTDLATGTGGDDTLVGGVGMLNAGDEIRAGGGSDTLQLSGPVGMATAYDLTAPAVLHRLRDSQGDGRVRQRHRQCGSSAAVLDDRSRCRNRQPDPRRRWRVRPHRGDADGRGIPAGPGSGDIVRLTGALINQAVSIDLGLGEDRLELTGGGTFSLSAGKAAGVESIVLVDGGEAVFANAASFDTALLIDDLAAPVTVNFIAGTLTNAQAAQLFANGVDKLIVGGMEVVNLPPTGMTIGVPAVVTENQPGDIVIATVTVDDPDTDPDFNTYTFQVSGEQADKFAVVNNELVLIKESVLDFEGDGSLDLTITATNTANADHVVSSTVTVQVQDVDEGPGSWRSARPTRSSRTWQGAARSRRWRSTTRTPIRTSTPTPSRSTASRRQSSM